jgi:membrane protease YdiL (CAAX protease family)
LQTPESGSSDARAEQPQATLSGVVAPVWHTVVLIAGIALLSVAGAAQLSGSQPVVNRLPTYAFTAATELFMLAWVYFGLRLRGVPFRSLLGSVSGSFHSVAVDFGLAMLFWMASWIVLGTVAIFWTVIEASITHHSLFSSGKQPAPDPTQQQTLHTLTQLAPANGAEVAAWILLCILAGLAEEMVFRGYLQRQFTAWSRGAAAAGVAFSALLFGAAHGYQGARNMVLLAVFGALFSLLALFRRSLRPGIFAHSWHDLFVGLMLAWLKAHHVV